MESNEYVIEFLPDALHDMTEIVSSFVMLGSKSGALRIKDKFNKAAAQIAAFPYSGIQIPDDKLAKSGYRLITAEKYLMFYRVFEDERKVVFYRALNGAMNYPMLLNKINPNNPEQNDNR